MNDDLTATLEPPSLPAAPWPQGQRLGVFELQETVARSAAGIVYRGWDHALALPVAVKEYLPDGLATRGGDGQVRPLDGDRDARDAFQRGLQAFVDAARRLAHADDPGLVRVLHLVQAHGTAYRVMPWAGGASLLLAARRDRTGAPDETTLRTLLDGLLGALEAYHRVGGVHGAVHPGQILLLGDGRPLLLGPADGAATGAAPEAGYAAPEQRNADATLGPWTDLFALAAVMRFFITGMAPPLLAPSFPEPLADTLKRLFVDVPAYSPALLQALDAASAPAPGARPQTVAQFRQRLATQPVLTAAARNQDDPTEALRRIQRTLDAVPAPIATDRPEPPLTARSPRRRAPRVEPPVEAASPDWRADGPAVDDSRTAFVPRRRGTGGWLGIGLAGAVVLGTVAWAWHDELPAIKPRPPTALAEPPAEPLAETLTADAPGPAPADPVPAPASAALPTPLAAAAPPPAPAPAPAAPEPPPVAAAPAPVPLPSLAPTVSSVAAVTVPAAAERPPAKPARGGAGGGSPTAAQRAARAEAAATNPRELCGGRTEFSLYRCMQQQCEQPRWARHAQCLRLRSSDRVD